MHETPLYKPYGGVMVFIQPFMNLCSIPSDKINGNDFAVNINNF